MVVLCPQCGREIFSDPDYCVMCGWTRATPRPKKDSRERSADRRRTAPPPSRYPRRGHETRYREPTERERYRPPPPRQGYKAAPRTQYRGQGEGMDYQRMPRERRMERSYADRYREEQGRGRPQRAYYEERKERPYQERFARDRYRAERQPVRDTREKVYDEPERNLCPNCGRENFTDPDNCIFCGWSRSLDERRTGRVYQERKTYERDRAPEYRSERTTRPPPSGWERHIEERMRLREPSQKVDRTRYRAETEAREPVKKTARERYVCENCGNPSLQFFADGFGRCPGCGNRFKYKSRAEMTGSKHKQFVCFKCDGKNLQFFTDGSGVCPHCKHEFRWKK